MLYILFLEYYQRYGEMTAARCEGNWKELKEI
jgi:hypothetical protein